MRTAAIAILLASTIVPAGAQDISRANFMLPHCKSGKETFWMGVCLGSITALAYLGPKLEDSLRFCFPKGVTQGQMVDVVVPYIEARPSRLHEDFRWLAVEAMREAWPCKGR